MLRGVIESRGVTGSAGVTGFDRVTGKGDAMVKVASGRVALSNGVEVALDPSGRIHWASDWVRLVRLEISGTGEVTRRALGPGTYCHTDYYVGAPR